jgi:hypothetical protein
VVSTDSIYQECMTDKRCSREKIAGWKAGRRIGVATLVGTLNKGRGDDYERGTD